MENGEYVKLPSKGVFYKNQYKGLSELKVRELNWEDEDILTTESYYKNGTLFEELLKNTIVDENGFSESMLTPVDRNTLLWFLRAKAFGTEYTIPKWRCSSEDCKKEFSVTWDLSDLETPSIPEEYREELNEKGSVLITLPISGLKCSITVPSIGREKEIEKKLKLKKEKTKTSKDFLTTGKLISIIEEVYDRGGASYKGSEEILKWLRTGNDGSPISLVDSRYILLKSKDISLEVDTRKDVVCPHCGFTQESIKMPQSIYFFWPDYDLISSKE